MDRRFCLAFSCIAVTALFSSAIYASKGSIEDLSSHLPLPALAHSTTTILPNPKTTLALAKAAKQSQATSATIATHHSSPPAAKTAFKQSEDLKGPTSQNKLTRGDIQRFAVVMAQIQHYYIKNTPYQELFDDAIRGMLTGLDPHSDYLNKKEYAQLRSTTSGGYAGIGVEIAPENGMIRVVSPFDGTPAFKAGIKPGDLIIKVDGHLIKNMSANEAVDLIKGKPGTAVELTIFRAGLKKPLTIRVKRERIKLKSVKFKLLPDKVGYIRLSVFSDKTGPEVKSAYKQIRKQAKGKLRGLILDMRNNPGGVLNAAVETADLFLDAKKLGKNDMIVYTQGRIKQANLQAHAKPGDISKGMPMVVLINGGSASASEIVAGALKDHHRAIILGTKSFGKGSVQTVLPIDQETAIKLTTALYYTPAGRSIQALGITPDVYVKYTKLPKSEEVKTLTNVIDENSLVGHIGTQPGNKKASKQSENDKKALAVLAEKDFQLYQAINFLKGLSALRSGGHG